MTLKLFLITLLLLGFVGCGGNASKEVEKGGDNVFALKGKAYQVLSGNLTNQDDFVAGTGRLVFMAPLPGVNSSQNLSLNMNLEDGGSLKLMAYGNEDLSGAAAILFVRTGNDIKIDVIDKDGTVTDSVARNATANGFSFNIDVHNGEGHILIWEGADKTPILESENEKNKGVGSFWGLELNKATVNNVAVRKAQHEH